MERKAKVLCVDDDKDYVRALRLVLESRYEVAVAHSKQEGLEMVRAVRPDVIVLDIMMGRKADGMLMARKLRRAKDFADYAKIPIVVLTGMREQTGFFFVCSPQHPVFFPIDDIVEKPVKPDVLLDKIQALLTRNGLNGGANGR